MTADHEAQRQAADQGALDVVADTLCVHGRVGSCAPECGFNHEAEAQHVLSALSAAGYSVVKTEALEAALNVAVKAIREPASPSESVLDLATKHLRALDEVGRIVGPWVPVPEGSAETRTAQQYVDAALNELPLLMAVERTYYDVVRSMTDDADVLAAVDKAEAAEGSADRGSEEGGER